MQLELNGGLTSNEAFLQSEQQQQQGSNKNPFDSLPPMHRLLTEEHLEALNEEQALKLYDNLMENAEKMREYFGIVYHATRGTSMMRPIGRHRANHVRKALEVRSSAPNDPWLELEVYKSSADTREECQLIHSFIL